MIFLQAGIPPALPEIPAHPAEAELLLRFHREPWAGLGGKSLAQAIGKAGGKQFPRLEGHPQYPGGPEPCHDHSHRDNLYLSVYDPDLRLRQLLQDLAASEGLFFWQPQPDCNA